MRILSMGRLENEATIWASFHLAMSSCVGTAEYDKKVWMAAEKQLIAAFRESRAELVRGSTEQFYA